jgi:NodT family efflux transporter outer membrane factor (OMF) lipoprotein
MRAALATVASAVLAAGCAATAPTPPSPPLPPGAERWQAPLPHGGDRADLVQWWRQFDDPLLPALIDAAQAASPTLAAATARIGDARAARTAAEAALAPRLDGQAGASRGAADPRLPAVGAASATLQAGWEIDLFGGGRATATAAAARLEGALASWHEARVAVAAETATSLVALRACEAQRALLAEDAASRESTARLTELSARAGFTAPADAALARASAAQGRAIVGAQQAQCDTLVKSLVELTALPEPELRQRLALRTGRVPQGAPVSVDTLPAALLLQRPDVHAAALEVAASAAEIAAAGARERPRVGLSGSIGALRIATAGIDEGGTTWTIGPLAIDVPLFDAGARAAATVAARERHDAAVVAYAAATRRAVREVEQVLVSLDATARREPDVRDAAAGFEAALAATEARQRGGLGSLIELEVTRRSALAASAGVVELQRERAAAWIALYRVLGGGWSAPTDPPATTASGTAPEVPPARLVAAPPGADDRSPVQR